MDERVNGFEENTEREKEKEREESRDDEKEEIEWKGRESLGEGEKGKKKGEQVEEMWQRGVFIAERIERVA